MDIKEFFDRQNWIDAKTYKEKAPHEYIVRSKINGTDKEFRDAVVFIRENGFKSFFWKKEYTYLKVDDKAYWTMGEPIEKTIIINRCDFKERFGDKADV